jgi:hypothetical protein
VEVVGVARGRPLRGGPGGGGGWYLDMLGCVRAVLLLPPADCCLAKKLRLPRLHSQGSSCKEIHEDTTALDQQLTLCLERHAIVAVAVALLTLLTLV